MELRVYDTKHRHYLKDPTKYKGDIEDLKWVARTETGENIRLSQKFNLNEFKKGTFTPPENILTVVNVKGKEQKRIVKEKEFQLASKNLTTGAIQPLDIAPMLVSKKGLDKANEIQKGSKVIVTEGIKFSQSDKKQEEPIHFLAGVQSKSKVQVKIFDEQGNFQKSLFNHKYVKLGEGDKAFLKNLNLDTDKIKKEFSIKGRNSSVRAVLYKAYEHISGDELEKLYNWDIYVKAFNWGEDIGFPMFGYDNVTFDNLIGSLENDIINAFWSQGYHFSNPTKLQSPEKARFYDEMQEREIEKTEGYLTVKFVMNEG